MSLKKKIKSNFGLGAVIGLTAVSLSIALASVPRRGMVTDDTAIYQKLSEIRVARETTPNFDSDINRLSKMEHHYRERLPLSKNPRLSAPLERVSKTKYRYSGSR